MKSSIFYILLLLIAILNRPDQTGFVSIDILISYLVLYLMGLGIHFYNRRKLKNWSRPEFFFLLGFTIVHIQWPIIVALGGNLEILTFYNVDFYHMNYGTWLALVGGLAWMYGFNFKYGKRKKLTQINERVKFNYTQLLVFCILSFFLFLIFVDTSFYTGGVYTGEGGSHHGTGVSAYFQMLFTITILILSVFVITESRTRKYKNPIFWLLRLNKKYLVLVGLYVLIFLSIGDRGGVLQLLIAMSILFGYFVRAISLKKIILLFFCGGILFTIIGLGRSTNNMFESGFDKLEKSEAPYLVTMQLSNSARVLYSAVENVPDKHGYFHGKLFIGNLLGVIPFAQSIYLKLSGIPEYELSSASYLTYIKYGKNPHTGEGTTIIADIYMNFGSSGVILLMFFLGKIFQVIQYELQLGSNINLIIIAVIVGSAAFYMGRANLLYPLKSIVWSLPIVFFFVKKLKIKSGGFIS